VEARHSDLIDRSGFAYYAFTKLMRQKMLRVDHFFFYFYEDIYIYIYIYSKTCIHGKTRKHIYIYISACFDVREHRKWQYVTQGLYLVGRIKFPLSFRILFLGNFILFYFIFFFLVIEEKVIRTNSSYL